MQLKIPGLIGLLDVLKSSGNIIITAHQGPDGDAVGSAMGLYHTLLHAGKKPRVLFPDSFPAFFSWLPGIENSAGFDLNPEAGTRLLQEADLIFCLDYNDPSRTGEAMSQPLARSQAIKVMIDHHPDPTSFCNYTISQISDCATAQLVYRLLVTLEMEHHVTPEAATALYMGIMTDTGSFRFPATSALTHRVIAKLMEHGARHSDIHTAVYDNNSENRLRLTGYALSEKLVVLSSHRTAYFWLTANELKRFNYQSGDTEGLVNYGLSIQGIDMAAIFLEMPGYTKISFRSAGEIPVNTLMKENFIGGGHKNAAGGKSFTSLHETIERFMSIIPGFMKQHG